MLILIINYVYTYVYIYIYMYIASVRQVASPERSSRRPRRPRGWSAARHRQSGVRLNGRGSYIYIYIYREREIDR